MITLRVLFKIKAVRIRKRVGEDRNYLYADVPAEIARKTFLYQWQELALAFAHLLDPEDTR